MRTLAPWRCCGQAASLVCGAALWLPRPSGGQLLHLIGYRLPPGPARYELFLETQGYYLEWIRQEWLAEENLPRAARLLLDPAGALRQMAPEYKRTEAAMESVFWSSRYGGQP